MFLARSGLRQVEGVPILDTISILLKMTEMMVRLKQITGTFVSRRLGFATPPKDIMKQLLEGYGIK